MDAVGLEKVMWHLARSDASTMVLVWQFDSVAMLAGLGALIGRQLLPWLAPRIASS